MSGAQIVIVSGGMGASGEQLARTALAQFAGAEIPLSIISGVRDAAELHAVVDRVAASGGLIIHTLVDAELRLEMVSAARAAGVSAIDVMGPVLGGISGLLGQEPLGKPGLYRRLREDYFRRVEAIEFAVRHDDGRRPEGLGGADIVLTGVSRAGKTPISMYLAMRGYKAANVPLVKGIAPPDELFRADHRRVVGLNVEAERLAAHRRRRQRTLGVRGEVGYSDPHEVFGDLEHALQVYRRGRFAIVDVTDKPIEESANEIVTLVTRAVAAG